ncbi:hypothetical protein LX64_02303 [Chitinophaga skermanii]|uniref:Uncharacterized protein n=1 Tax=Chitinophaga skermanii TaxID=331697 RepID=A0A327QKT1_9BACT|nr:hypothetical protein [Chitinophaga skermanii]RAJ05149.1 hypothetical protein LX64_02303 [Chitinophaga skermanii]
MRRSKNQLTLLLLAILAAVALFFRWKMAYTKAVKDAQEKVATQ